MSIKRGHCFCGKVSFEFEGDINWSGYCHCESCRRTTSSPMTTFFAVPRPACRFTGEEPAVYQSSEGVRRLFCAACGSPVAYDADAYPHEMHFYTASLEAPADIEPTFHVFCAEKVPWLEIDDELPRYAATAKS